METSLPPAKWGLTSAINFWVAWKSALRFLGPAVHKEPHHCHMGPLGSTDAFGQCLAAGRFAKLPELGVTGAFHPTNGLSKPARCISWKVDSGR